VPQCRLPPAEPRRDTIRQRTRFLPRNVPALKPDEILTAIEIPLPPEGYGYAYEKLKRKIGD